MSTSLRIVPLGGLGEVGMNCMVVEVGEARVIIDCGVTFPGRTHGVDLAHPRFDYLLAEPARLQAVLITHGHEDHIGALPYLMRGLRDAGISIAELAVYGPPYALRLIERRLEEFDLGRPDLRPTQPRQRFQVGPFNVEPYRVNHSIPDATGLVLRTHAGVLIHSGDFKIEERPVDGRAFDRERLREIGDEGVDLLLSDSTNIDSVGDSGEEDDVEKALLDHIADAPGRVVVALFASNVYRIQACLRAAEATHRRVLLLGRSVETHGRVARETGFLRGIDHLLVTPEQAHAIPRDQLLVVATGTQGEWPSALARLSRGDHRDLSLDSGDRVILSSRVIPGAERLVYGMIDDLERQGVDVRTRRYHPEVHVSGHACRDEQRELLELVRPRTFVPVHGTFHHMRAHAALARETGVDETAVIENGSILELRAGRLREVGSAPAGRVMVDRQHPLDERQLRDRRLMGELGVAFVALAVDPRQRLLGPVDVTQRGFLRDDEEALLDDASRYVTRDLERRSAAADLDELEDRARRALKRFFARELGRKPIVIPLAVEARP